jgi:hypothetical protein
MGETVRFSLEVVDCRGTYTIKYDYSIEVWYK